MENIELKLMAEDVARVFLNKWHPEIKLRKQIQGRNEINAYLPDPMKGVPTYAIVDMFIQPPTQKYGEWQKIIIIPIGEYFCIEEIESRGYFHRSVLSDRTSLDHDEIDEETMDAMAKDVTIEDATWKLHKKEVSNG